MNQQTSPTRGIIITAVITFVATSALWLLLLRPSQTATESIDQPSTNAFSEMEASSNATIYNAEGEWVGTGLLVETAREATLQIGSERYTLQPSDHEGYRYRIDAEKLYVK